MIPDLKISYRVYDLSQINKGDKIRVTTHGEEESSIYVVDSVLKDGWGNLHISYLLLEDGTENTTASV